MALSIAMHNIVSIQPQEVRKLENTQVYARHLLIAGQDGEALDVILFSERAENLEIQPYINTQV